MPNRDDEQILGRWREFLTERLGGTEMTIEEMMGGSPNEMIEVIREHIAADPEAWGSAMIDPMRIRTMPDAEMVTCQEAIFESYGFALPIYDQMVIMRELLPTIMPQASLLDVGWRPCYFPVFLQKEGIVRGRTVGVTPSEAAVRRLLEIVGDESVFMEMKLGSPLDLPFDDDEFGQVISIDLLHWLHGWRKAISEIARVAAESAPIFISLVSNSVRNGEIDIFAVAETLTKNGVDVQRLDTFPAEKSQSPRLFVAGVKDKPKGQSQILIPVKTNYRDS